MSKRIFAVALLAAFFAALPHHIGAQEDATADADKALQAKIEKLIEQLGSGEFEERKAAQEALLDIGEDAREALENALKNPDPEIAAAATTVLKQMDLLRLVFVCTDEKGAPLKDKTLTIAVKISQPYDPDNPYTAPEEIEKSGKIAEDGTFRLEPFDGKVVEITAEIEGFAPIRSNRLTFQGGKYVIPLRFIPSGTVKGVVIDAGNKNTPVGNANVHIKSENVQTDENGRFKIENLAPGKHWIYILKSGLEAIERETTVTVKSGKTSEVTIKMAIPPKARSEFRCVILTPDGMPYANQPATLLMEEGLDGVFRRSNTFGPLNEYHSGTDESGTFRFPLLDTGRYRLSLVVPGYKPVRLGEQQLKPGEIWQPQNPVKLEKGLNITVSVKDADGKPVPGAIVIVRSLKDDKIHFSSWNLFEQNESRLKHASRRHGICKANEKGIATISGIEEGDTAVLAVQRGYAVGRCKIINPKKDGTASVEFSLVRTATATVKVIDEDTKNVIQGAWAWRWLSCETGNDAINIYQNDRYESSGGETHTSIDLESGKNYIIAIADGYRSGYIAGEFKPGENRALEISLKKMGKGALTGSVKGGADISLPKMYFVLLYSIQAGSDASLVLRVHRDGSFRVPELQEGLWRIFVLGKNDSILGDARFTIEKGKTLNISVNLVPLGALELSLLDHEGKPIENTEIGLFKRAFDTYPVSSFKRSFFYATADDRLETDEAGKCKIENFLPGKYEITRKRTGPGLLGSGQMWNTTVEAGKTTKLTLKVAKTATIEGRLSTKYKLPMDVMLFPQSDKITDMLLSPVAQQSNVTAGETFKLEKVPPGKYLLAAMLPHSIALSSYFVKVEVREGVPVKGIELRFSEKMRKVSGKIAGYKYHTADTGPSDILILIGKSMSATAVNPDGTFETAAPPGKYKVVQVNIMTIMLGGQVERTPVEIEVKEGEDLTDVELP